MNAQCEIKFHATTHDTLFPDRKLAGAQFPRRSYYGDLAFDVVLDRYHTIYWVAVIKKQSLTCLRLETFTTISRFEIYLSLNLVQTNLL